MNEETIIGKIVGNKVKFELPNGMKMVFELNEEYLKKKKIKKIETPKKHIDELFKKMRLNKDN